MEEEYRRTKEREGGREGRRGKGEQAKQPQVTDSREFAFPPAVFSPVIFPRDSGQVSSS